MKKIINKAIKVVVGSAFVVMTSVHPAPNKECKAMIQVKLYRNGKIVKIHEHKGGILTGPNQPTLLDKDYDQDSTVFSIVYK